MRLRKELKVRIIANLPQSEQTEFSIESFIGKEYEIADHYQNYNSGLDKGKIQIIIPESGRHGIVVLNEGEWELV